MCVCVWGGGGGRWACGVCRCLVQVYGVYVCSVCVGVCGWVGGCLCDSPMPGIPSSVFVYLQLSCIPPVRLNIYGHDCGWHDIVLEMLALNHVLDSVNTNHLNYYTIKKGNNLYSLFSNDNISTYLYNQYLVIFEDILIPWASSYIFNCREYCL